MDATINLQLFASLAALMPDNASRYPITEGMTIGQLVERLSISVSEAKLIFVDGRRAKSQTRLHGGERVGIFPPVGGG